MTPSQFTCPEADEPVTIFPSVPQSLWQFPTLATVPLGDPHDISMQFTALHHDRMENILLKEEAVAHSALLRLKTFQLQEAERKFSELQNKLASLIEKLEQAEARLKEFEAKEEAYDRFTSSLWSTGSGRIPDITWHPAPVLLDGPGDSALLDQPLALERVLQDMGYQYRPTDVQKLSVLVYREYVKQHGKAPFPNIYCGQVGQMPGLSGFTEKDRPLIASVIEEQGGRLFHLLPTAD